MPELTADPALIARCGLYCGACRKYLKGSCPGCAGNEKASWCTIRGCTAERGIASCADCDEFPDLRDCKQLNGWVAKMFGVVFRSDRIATLTLLREVGPERFAVQMTRQKRPSLPR